MTGLKANIFRDLKTGYVRVCPAMTGILMLSMSGELNGTCPVIKILAKGSSKKHRKVLVAMNIRIRKAKLNRNDYSD